MSSISSSTASLLAPSMAFVSPTTATAATAAWQEAQLRRTFSRKSFTADDINNSEEDDLEQTEGEFSTASTSSDYYENNSSRTTVTKKKFSMGASIGAQNVGEMLFNEELLKSGRGDVRVGPMRRWKDFRGNEIVPTDNTDTPN